MRAGQLRHFVTVQQVTETQDASGQPIESWATYIQRWASVKPLSGDSRELFTSAQRWPEVEVKITLRGDETTRLITPKMRVLFGTKIYNILAAVDIEERGIKIELMCRKEG